MIYADTCAEWLVSALACYKNNYTIVTLYTNLGPEGVTYGIQQVEAKLVITAQALTTKLLETLKTFDNQVRHVVYIQDPLRQQLDVDDSAAARVSTFSSVEELGKSAERAQDEAITKDDIGMIMYTSGSTGQPKGDICS